MADETIRNGQDYIRYLADQARTARNSQQPAVVATQRQAATVTDTEEDSVRTRQRLTP